MGVDNALAPVTVETRPEISARIVEHRLRKRQDTAAWVAQATAGTTFDAFDRLAEIRAPTLVLHGTEDVVVDPRNAELIARAIPNASLELFQGAGHVFFWEEPERFVRVTTDFLKAA